MPSKFSGGANPGFANGPDPAVCKTSLACRSIVIEPLVLALGDLQVQRGALAVNHYRSRVEQLLASTVIGSEAAHHTIGKEELHRLSLRPIAKTDRTAEVDSVEVNLRRKVVQQRPYEMRHVLVERQCRKFVARTSRRRFERG